MNPAVHEHGGSDGRREGGAPRRHWLLPTEQALTPATVVRVLPTERLGDLGLKRRGRPAITNIRPRILRKL